MRAPSPDQKHSDIGAAWRTRWAQSARRAIAAHVVVLLTTLLWVSSFVMCYALLTTPVSDDNVGLMKLTESYGALERVALWQRSLSWFPGGNADGTFVTWPRPLIAWSVRLAMVVMFALQAGAFAAAWRSGGERPLRWLVGPIGAHAIMLLMVPSNADVFFYSITGDLANQGLNPYTTPLYEVPQHPTYPFNHWVDMASVYGPLWTLMSQGVVTIGGSDPAASVLGFKILFGLVAIAVTVGVYGTARLLGLTPGLATAAMVLVGWQPNLIIESAGQAHNDIIMIGLVLAAVALGIAGGAGVTRGAIVLAALSAAVKYVSLPMIGLLALTRLDRLRASRGAHRIPATWSLDLLAVAAVLVAAFGPYWIGPSMLKEMLAEPGRLYSNPIWHGCASLVGLLGSGPARTFEDVTRLVAQVVTIAAIVVVLVRFALGMWRSNPPDEAASNVPPRWAGGLLVSWALVFLILSYVPVNAHAWYWTWPVAPVALLSVWHACDRTGMRRKTPKWLGAYLVTNAILTLIYYTRIVHS